MSYEELNSFRIELGLTIEQFAKFLGKTPAAYKRWNTAPNGVPLDIQYRVEELRLLSSKSIGHLMTQREI